MRLCLRKLTFYTHSSPLEWVPSPRSMHTEEVTALTPVTREMCPKRMGHRNGLGDKPDVRKYLGLKYGKQVGMVGPKVKLGCGM